MNEAGFAWSLALTLRYSGNAGSEVVFHSTQKVMNVLLWVHGMDAEMLSFDKSLIHSSDLGGSDSKERCVERQGLTAYVTNWAFKQVQQQGSQAKQHDL